MGSSFFSQAGSGFTQLGGIGATAGFLPQAQALSALGGALSAIGGDPEEEVENPFQGDPYAPGGVLWGVPKHPDDIEIQEGWFAAVEVFGDRVDLSAHQRSTLLFQEPNREEQAAISKAWRDSGFDVERTDGTIVQSGPPQFSPIGPPRARRWFIAEKPHVPLFGGPAISVDSLEILIERIGEQLAQHAGRAPVFGYLDPGAPPEVYQAEAAAWSRTIAERERQARLAAEEARAVQEVRARFNSLGGRPEASPASSFVAPDAILPVGDTLRSGLVVAGVVLGVGALVLVARR